LSADRSGGHGVKTEYADGHGGDDQSHAHKGRVLKTVIEVKSLIIVAMPPRVIKRQHP
jgi:hypothetical protein